ncbi:MAG: nucleotidyltransferase domain-containing protein [archaeon]
MLEKLFTSKNRIKILEFFFFKKNESHTREIARELKIPVSAVKREIDNLISLSLLKIDKRNIVLNKKCNYLDDLKNIFIKTDSIVYPIQDVLKNIKADFILIFGSFARGEFNEESDVDLMVVGNIGLDKVIKTISPIEDKIKRDINPVVWKLDELRKKKNTGFVKDIFKKGIILIKGDENELWKIIR